MSTSVLPETLTSILQPLTDNALQHGGAECKVRLSMRTDDEQETMNLRVSDNGPGVSSNNEQRIFDPFFTTAPDRGNTGLDLPIFRARLSAHGGSIALIQDESPRATFEILLPGQTHDPVKNN